MQMATDWARGLGRRLLAGTSALGHEQMLEQHSPSETNLNSEEQALLSSRRFPRYSDSVLKQRSHQVWRRPGTRENQRPNSGAAKSRGSHSQRRRTAELLGDQHQGRALGDVDLADGEKLKSNILSPRFEALHSNSPTLGGRSPLRDRRWLACCRLSNAASASPTPPGIEQRRVELAYRSRTWTFP